MPAMEGWCELLSSSCAAGAQEKRSAYAPSEEQPVRYDGCYRIVRAYRKPGAQGQLVCRYLFIRADNEPAPWSSEGGHAPPVLCLPQQDLSCWAAAEPHSL